MIPQINPLAKYTTPDGRLTLEGQQFFAALLRVLADYEARLTAGSL